MEEVILYLRVSTGDQSNSLEVQKNRLTEYCSYKNLAIKEIIVDEDISGHKPFYERPGGAIAKELFRKGIKTIVVLKIDRIFRNVKDSLITIDEWQEEDIALHVADIGGNSIDVKTAMGRMFFIQAVSMGELERNLAAERTKAVLNNKKDTGKVYCNAILGFDKVEGKLVKNEEEYKVIEFIQQFKDELSPAKISDKLNAAGYRAKKGGVYFPSTIQSILKNPIYSNC